MEGGTTFHFVTGGIRDALARAREAAGERDVRIGGGPNTIQQYLRASLIDESARYHWQDSRHRSTLSWAVNARS